MAKVDFQNRPPITERLPDGRLRATTLATVKNFSSTTEAELESEVFREIGTQLASFGDCRLIRCRLIAPEPNTKDPLLELTYEELHQTNETQVGQNTIVIGQDGRRTIQATFLQFSSAPATPGTIGVSTPPAPDNAAGVMSEEKVENDGTLRTITRTYIASGTLSESTTFRNNGKLELRTIQTVGIVPATPLGFELVETKEENSNGLPIYTYQFAKGSGRISRKETLRLNDKLLLVTIRYLNTDDGPAESGNLIDTDTEEKEGYTLITETYSEIVGDGLVQDEKEIKNNGKLVIYRRSRLGTPPTTPSATIGGTVVETSRSERAEDGHILYIYEWAEGKGVISTQETKRPDGTVLERRIRELGGVPATPSGFYLLRAETSEQDGVTLYDYTFRLTTATQEEETITRIGSHSNPILQIKRYTREVSTPAPDPAGFTLVDYATEQRDDGRTFYRWTYANGSGEVSRTLQVILNGAVTYTTVRSIGATRVAALGEFEYDDEQEAGYTVWRSRGVTINNADLPDEVETRNQTLAVTTKRKINTAPTPPVGALTLSTGEEPREGFTIHVLRYATGSGEISRNENVILDGAVTYTTVRALNTPEAAPGEFETSEEKESGFTVHTSRGVTINNADLPDETEIRYSGQLVIVTKQRINTDPASPGFDWVLISNGKQPREGFTVHFARYAVGSGRISLDSQAIAQGKALLHTVRYLGNDDEDPPPGTLVTSESSEQTQDGYYLSTRVYIEIIGDGVIEDSHELRNNGNLAIYRRSRINNPPDAPAPVVGDAVAEISRAQRPERYFTLHTYQWASGEGRISTEPNLIVDGHARTTTIQFLENDSGSTPAGTLKENSSREVEGLTLITQVYLEVFGSGLVEDSKQVRNGGSLITYRRTRINQAPEAPAPSIAPSIAEISRSERPEKYFTLHTYEWAEGNGIVSDETENRYNGALAIRTQTVLNMVYDHDMNPLTPPPDPAPIAGEVSRSMQERDGHRLWTLRGITVTAGLITTDSEDRQGGKLKTQTHTYLTAAGEADPLTTPPAGFTRISISKQEQDGHIVWRAVFAQGSGRIGVDSQAIAQGKAILRTVRWLDADDEAAPVGTLLTNESSDVEQDGYTVGTRVYLEVVGNGLIEDSEQVRNNAKLYTFRRSRINQYPDTPTSKLGEALFETSSSTRIERYFTIHTKEWAEGVGRISFDQQDLAKGKAVLRTIRYIDADDSVAPAGTVVDSSFVEQDRHTLHTKTYLEIVGDGVVQDETDVRENGKLKIYRRQRINADPADPAATISGTVTLISSGTRPERYYVLHSKTWAEGVGVVEEDIRTLNEGIRQVTRTILGTRTGYDPAGSIVAVRESEDQGHKRYVVTALQAPDGTSLTGAEGAAKLIVQYERLVTFEMPGVVDLVSETFQPNVTWSAGTLIRLEQQVPPTPIRVKAKIYVFYQTNSNVKNEDLNYDSAVGFWNPATWPVLNASFWPTSGVKAVTSEGLRGWRMANLGESPKSISTTSYVNNAHFNNVLGSRCYFELPNTVTLSGGPPDPTNQKYVLDVDLQEAFQLADGTRVYRKTIAVAIITPATHLNQTWP